MNYEYIGPMSSNEFYGVLRQQKTVCSVLATLTLEVCMGRGPLPFTSFESAVRISSHELGRHSGDHVSPL
jgi:hypothetical protein